MKITIYELIGLIKDNKAPKKIKYNNEIWKYDDELKTYDNDDYDRDLLEKLFYESYILDFINDEVEIIEEPKKIEKIEMHQDEEGHYFLNKRDRKVYVNCDEMDFMVDKFNELIDEINNLKEKKLNETNIYK